MSRPRRQLESQFTAGLVRIARLYRKEVDRALAAYGISDAKAVPVLHIARHGGGMRQHALAEEIGIEGPSLVRLLDQLCAHQLVERHDDSHDRRAKTLHLTAAGSQLAARVEGALGEIRTRLLAACTMADLGAALRVLEALEGGLDATADSEPEGRP